MGVCWSGKNNVAPHPVGRERSDSEVIDSICSDKYVSTEHTDLSHFFVGCRLGRLYDGLGDTRAVLKLSGKDEGRWYAVKMRDKELICGSVGGQRAVFAELRALAALTPHPFIQHAHYAFPGPESIFLVLDIQLGSLLSNNGDYQVAEMTARFYTSQIVKALGHIHTCGIIHRDVTLDSIFLLSNG